MNGDAFRIGRGDVSADCGQAGNPPPDKRHFLASAAARTVLAAAMLVVALIDGSHAVALQRPAPVGDGTTQHFLTVEIHEGRVASAARRQFVAAGRVSV
jgi:hypothetical protein